MEKILGGDLLRTLGFDVKWFGKVIHGFSIRRRYTNESLLKGFITIFKNVGLNHLGGKSNCNFVLQSNIVIAIEFVIIFTVHYSS